MKTYCTRPNCSHPINDFPELNDRAELQKTSQKSCHSCGMPQILAGRYVPQKLLGKGGFGAAYLAIDRHSPQFRQCVVKQFQPSTNFKEKNLKIAEELFVREAEVLESLGNYHPQIPDLYAFFPLVSSAENGDEKEFFYIVQEFIDGATLEEEVQRKGRLNEANVIAILEDLLPVLQFVHEHNSIHRDIKPSNIMRDREGKLYLLDFGAVKRVTGATTGNNYSTGIYSMGFAPPEQMQGREIYPSTDLYALAATCLCLLTGQPIRELYDSYNNQWRWDICPEISEKLGKVLQKMLLTTPKHRFASAQGVLNALQTETTSETKPEITTATSSEAPLLSQPANLQSLFSVSQPPLETNASQEDATAASSTPQSVSAPTEQQMTPATPPSSPTSLQPLSGDSPSPEATPQRSHFSLWEILAHAGFTGSEGALLLIAFSSVFPAPALSMGLWGMSMGGLIYAQWKRWIEKFNLLLLGSLTLGLVLLIPPLSNPPALTVVVTTVVAGSGAIALISFFRLILYHF